MAAVVVAGWSVDNAVAARDKESLPARAVIGWPLSDKDHAGGHPLELRVDIWQSKLVVSFRFGLLGRLQGANRLMISQCITLWDCTRSALVSF